MVTEADLANMTPEQIMELQKQNCIFCRIIEGKVASKKVYEDEKSIAILDINPANPGHLLILPKEHFAIMPQMPDELLAHLAMVSKALSNAGLKSLKTTGSTLFIANGQLAGQQAPHFMIHLIPRKEGDGLQMFSLPKNKVDDAEMNKVYNSVSSRLKELMGVKEDTHVEKKQELQKPKETQKEEAKESQKEQNIAPQKPESTKDLPQNENINKENIENLKAFIKSNPSLKKMIKNDTEVLIELLKKNPQVKQFLNEDEIKKVLTQLKKEIEQESESGEDLDFDGLSNMLIGK